MSYKSDTPMQFRASASSVQAETIVNFLKLKLYECDLKDIPGIGPAAAHALNNQGVYSPAQLLAKFLSFSGPMSTVQETCDSFYRWFHEHVPRANGHSLTFAIANYADEKGMINYNLE